MQRVVIGLGAGMLSAYCGPENGGVVLTSVSLVLQNVGVYNVAMPF